MLYVQHTDELLLSWWLFKQVYMLVLTCYHHIGKSIVDLFCFYTKVKFNTEMEKMQEKETKLQERKRSKTVNRSSV